mmetsp:Transcript_7026/g.7891  ORF Transcript_7026/g.7891 Transcript_7026/m.7891 type:complete len:188 (+) Transcript_7026:451-1014(+)|eukprot:CAMPEP_0205800822 /NCGR_PEP_ID=MMETSP0205-20121125/2607_1 /ASSEMBLY_ACC=CAM_ASM_000278 /TAXON_ID=36767 /ORGANISM="Euplotes focardii, Strain TN1" /LENGTH=187 /DNA_ID=CAMNT_0053064547 /DNA_START=352 /DNA_END=915 /DNA_ORIENTATION=-
MTPLSKQQLGWPEGGFPEPGNSYYCGVGTHKTEGRELMNQFLNACIYTSIQISGLNSGNKPGEWEFEIGPCQGTEIGDHLWVARYLLARVTEDYGIGLKYDTKPIECRLHSESGFKHATITAIGVSGDKNSLIPTMNLMNRSETLESEDLSTESDDSEKISKDSPRKELIPHPYKIPSSLESKPLGF